MREGYCSDTNSVNSVETVIATCKTGCLCYRQYKTASCCGCHSVLWCKTRDYLPDHSPLCTVCYLFVHVIINPRRACAARFTVVVLCVSVSVCPGLASATHATTRPSRHTYGPSIVLAPDRIWRFSYNGLVSKIAIALPYSRAHGSRPFLHAKRAHFPHSFRILRS